MGGMLLDTNVLSELMRAKPAAQVLNWFGRQQNASYFVSVISFRRASREQREIYDAWIENECNEP